MEVRNKEGLLRRSATLNEALPGSSSRKFSLNFDLNNNRELVLEGGDGEEKTFIWDWPLSQEGESLSLLSARGMARGFQNDSRFVVCLPLNNGGSGSSKGLTKKFERITESNFSWSLGLGRDDATGSFCFWRVEIQVQPSLNALFIVASRDISRFSDKTKRLKRVRKVYRLPDFYDVSTLKTTVHDCAIVLEATRRLRPRPSLSRADTVS